MEMIYSWEQNGFYRFHQATVDSNWAAQGCKMNTDAFFKVTLTRNIHKRCLECCCICVTRKVSDLPKKLYVFIHTKNRYTYTHTHTHTHTHAQVLITIVTKNSELLLISVAKCMTREAPLGPLPHFRPMTGNFLYDSSSYLLSSRLFLSG